MRALALLLLLSLAACAAAPAALTPIPGGAPTVALPPTLAAAPPPSPTPTATPTRTAAPSPTQYTIRNTATPYSLPLTPYPTPIVTPPAEEAITALVDRMAAAVRARDRDAYLAWTALNDPILRREHTRLVDEWAGEQVTTSYEMSIRDITVQGGKAEGTLEIRWATETMEERVAGFRATFLHEGGEWKYAGEQWERFESDYFVVLAAPGVEPFAEEILPVLPAIYAHVTRSLGYEPRARSTIKLYDSSEDLVANTLLSLPDITGWNEPGESLKLFEREGREPAAVIAHEFTHFLTFDMAGMTHGNTPWWLMEGIAEYVAMEFRPAEDAKDIFGYVVELARNDDLVPWEQISDFNNLQTERWGDAYPQGYSLVRYVTETYGEEARNEWLRHMSGEDMIDTATVIAFDVTFEEIDAAWRKWLLDTQ